MTEQHQAYDRPRHIPTFSERLAGAARAQPAGLLLLFAGTSLLLSGMRPPSAATARRARGPFRGRRRQSWMMATARVGPAEPPTIFRGKQATVKPTGGRAPRLHRRSI